MMAKPHTPRFTGRVLGVAHFCWETSEERKHFQVEPSQAFATPLHPSLRPPAKAIAVSKPLTTYSQRLKVHSHF